MEKKYTLDMKTIVNITNEESRNIIKKTDNIILSDAEINSFKNEARKCFELYQILKTWGFIDGVFTISELKKNIFEDVGKSTLPITDTVLKYLKQNLPRCFEIFINFSIFTEVSE